MTERRSLAMEPQPDDSTCGPACLHALYRYYGEDLSLAQVIDAVHRLENGGTLAVHLACDALRRGYSAHIYTYNLDLFDPSWFERGVDLASRLVAQARWKRSRRLREASAAYLEFLELGGTVGFEELSTELIRSHLDRDRPILTGLSATYLYACAREIGDEELEYDDVRGEPVGHFVVLHGYDDRRERLHVADPTAENPRFAAHHYEVGVERVLGAILLGVLTYDANLLVIEPSAQGGSS
jgi:hypothetical protein